MAWGAISDGATIVVDNSGDPAVGSGVLSFSLGALSNKTDAVREFMAAYEKAMDDINHDPARWSSLLSEKQLVPEALVGKYQVPRFPVGKVPTEAQFMDVENWMTSQGLIKTQVPYAKLVNTSFLPK